MKRRILNLGIPATHDLITDVANLNEVISISDADAFVFEPQAMRKGVTPENYQRRQIEIRDLVVRKGGLVLCLLRQVENLGFPYQGGYADSYGLFELVLANVVAQIRSLVRAGWGHHVNVVLGVTGASAGYFRILEGALSFAAYFQGAPATVEALGGTVLAVDSVPNPIGVEFLVGAGRICFVPIPDGATGDRVGSALVRVVEAHYGGPSEIEFPAWLADIGVPGARAHDAAISELGEKKEQIEAEVGRLEQRRTELLNYRILLYGYGKSVLEPVVRRAFRLLGFGVPEPDQYKGEWDVELHEPRSSLTAIGEVEGSEGVVDVDKYRQLLDYVQAEVLEGRDHKGILIGNGYRLAALDAPERQRQFSNHALLGAKKNGFCLAPTTELFKAVCAVLENLEDEGRKIRIRDSIFSTVGVWRFAREVAVQQDSAAASATSTSSEERSATEAGAV